MEPRWYLNIMLLIMLGSVLCAMVCWTILWSLSCVFALLGLLCSALLLRAGLTALMRRLIALGTLL